MSYQALSDEQKTAGRECLELLDEYGLGVQGAVWVYVKALQEWRFYLVTSLVDIDGLVETYNRVERLFGLKFRNANLTMEDIHFGSPDEELFMRLAGALNVQGISGIELHDCDINGLLVERAYIYRLERAPPVIKAKQARQKFDKRLKQLEDARDQLPN